jgi:ABC-type Na+ efflux pump permease subunit
MSVMLIGFGLLLGGLFRTVTQLNTWSSIAIMLVTFPAFMVAVPLPDALATVVNAFPTAQAMRLVSNGLSGSDLFANAWLAYPIIAAWCMAVYGLLLWRLSRQEA